MGKPWFIAGNFAFVADDNAQKTEGQVIMPTA
jgi:hypothetical protein